MTSQNDIVPNLHTRLYIDAAERLNLTTKVLDESCSCVLLYNQYMEIYVMSAVVSVNSTVAHLLSKNKFHSARIFERSGLPTPKNLLITSEESLEGNHANISELLSQSSSLVVKRVKGMGGESVFLGITSIDEASAISRRILSKGYQVLMESFIEGSNYRALVSNGKVIDVLLRLPPSVQGDGVTTIGKLIEKKNTYRSRYTKSLIQMDKVMDVHLTTLGFSVDTVLPDGVTIDVRPNVNFSTGGEVARIDIGTIHPDNLTVFVEAARCIGLSLAGVDFITTDLSKSWVTGNGSINEINSCPSVDIHYWPSLSKSKNMDVCKVILADYFNL